MATKFLSPAAQYHAGVNVREGADTHEEGLPFAEPVTSADAPVARTRPTASFAIQNDEDAPACSTCGAIMIRNGSCYKCINCGATSGCA